jgi:hypothetical protein
MKKSNLKQLIKEALEAETIEMVEPYNEVGDIILVMKPRKGMSMDDMIRTTSVYDDISKDSLSGVYMGNNMSEAKKAAKMALKEYEDAKKALQKEMEEYRAAKEAIEAKKEKAKGLIEKLR